MLLLLLVVLALVGVLPKPNADGAVADEADDAGVDGA